MRPADAGLYDDVLGQERAVAQLRAAAANPVHAYLFLGPPGSGKRAAARSFAAALLCPTGGCGVCRSCVLARSEAHPDLVVVEPEGSFLLVKQADDIVRQANLSPVEGQRQVLLLADFNSVHPQAAPKLLKTIEEPPASTVFVILVEDVPPELGTIASRCALVEFCPVPTEAIVSALVAEGADAGVAFDAARAAGGRLDRARLLASDPGFASRRSAWAAVPQRLDGTGAAVVLVVDELTELTDEAVRGSMEVRQAAEVAALEERVRRYGERGAGRKQLEDRHKRERKRLRTEELRFGFATLQRVYRDALASGAPVRPCLGAISAIAASATELVRNPNEALLMQALLLELPPLGPFSHRLGLRR